MKKFFVCAMVVLMLFSFVSCGKKSAEAEVLELSISSGGSSAASLSGEGVRKFAEKVEEYSNGTLKANIFYDTTLGNATSVVSGLMQGTVDFVACGNAYFSGLLPELQAIELPYLFDGPDEARAALSQDEVINYISEKLEPSGIKFLRFWEIGFRELSNNIRPIHSVEDMKGIKLRCLPSTYQVKSWEAAGAIPVPMDVSELYSSLQQKVVDGQENPISEIYAQRFYEVQKYISISNHVYTPVSFACSKMTWDRMTPEQQDAVVRAAKDAQAEVYKTADENNAKLIEEIKAAGVEIATDVDTASFREKMAPVHDLFKKEVGTELLSILK